jgi:hypothetical protein
MMIGQDCFFFLDSKEIPGYLYKVLDSGVPRHPTYDRFKAGLAIHGLYGSLVDLYEPFEREFMTVRLGELYEKLNRSYVNSDTGNYCSFHTFNPGYPWAGLPHPFHGRPPTPDDGSNPFGRTKGGVTDPKYYGGRAGCSPDEAEGAKGGGGDDGAKSGGDDDGAESDATEILEAEAAKETGAGAKKESKEKTFPIPDDMKPENLAQVVAMAMGR